MKLGITGTRKYDHQETINYILDEFSKDKQIDILISGGAVGVDACCESWAKSKNIPIRVIKPDYETNGKRATLLRNQLIVEESDEMVGFPLTKDKSRTFGTWFTIDYAKRIKKPVTIHEVKIV